MTGLERDAMIQILAEATRYKYLSHELAQLMSFPDAHSHRYPTQRYGCLRKEIQEASIPSLSLGLKLLEESQPLHCNCYPKVPNPPAPLCQQGNKLIMNLTGSHQAGTLQAQAQQMLGTTMGQLTGPVHPSPRGFLQFTAVM